jgi:hypothetical protein
MNMHHNESPERSPEDGHLSDLALSTERLIGFQLQHLRDRLCDDRRTPEEIAPALRGLEQLLISKGDSLGALLSSTTDHDVIHELMVDITLSRVDDLPTMYQQRGRNIELIVRLCDLNPDLVPAVARHCLGSITPDTRQWRLDALRHADAEFALSTIHELLGDAAFPPDFSLSRKQRLVYLQDLHDRAVALDEVAHPSAESVASLWARETGTSLEQDTAGRLVPFLISITQHDQAPSLAVQTLTHELLGRLRDSYVPAPVVTLLVTHPPLVDAIATIPLSPAARATYHNPTAVHTAATAARSALRTHAESLQSDPVSISPSVVAPLKLLALLVRGSRGNTPYFTRQLLDTIRNQDEADGYADHPAALWPHLLHTMLAADNHRGILLYTISAELGRRESPWERSIEPLVLPLLQAHQEELLSSLLTTGDPDIAFGRLVAAVKHLSAQGSESCTTVLTRWNLMASTGTLERLFPQAPATSRRGAHALQAALREEL